MSLNCAQHEGVLGDTHPFAYELPKSPCHGNQALLHSLWSRLFGSQYDSIGRWSFGSFCLPTEQPVSPGRPASDSRGPSNGLGSQQPSWVSQVNGVLGESSVPIPVGTFSLYGSGNFWWFFFCTSLLIFTGPASSSGCDGLGRLTNSASLPLLDIISTLFGTSGMEDSSQDLSFLSRIMAYRTLNLNLSDISIFGRHWWSSKDHVKVQFLQIMSLHVGLHP